MRRKLKVVWLRKKRGKNAERRKCLKIFIIEPTVKDRQKRTVQSAKNIFMKKKNYDKEVERMRKRKDDRNHI